MGGNVKWVYILYAAVLLPLIPTADLSENVSPMVASLNRWGIGWAGTALKVVVWLLCFPSFIFGMYYRKRTNAKDSPKKGLSPRDFQPSFASELSEELVETVDESTKEK